jgi:hypothetical protein
MALINCTPPITYDIPGCIDEVIVNTDLTASATYSAIFEFQNGFKLKENITLDGDSALTLTKDDFLLGFWNEGTRYVTLTIDTFSIILNFTNIQTDDVTITIG